MGAADVVPGVSGATIALILGIYERLISCAKTLSTALLALAKLNLRDTRIAFKSTDWHLLLSLLAGIMLAVLSLASTINDLLISYPTELAGLFCGLTIASAATTCQLFNWKNPLLIALTASVAAVSFYMLGFQLTSTAHPPLLAFFGAGAIAVCAMVLPGVSGSFVMLMLGMYTHVIASIDERALDNLAVLALGALTGIICFSALLGHLMETARDVVMSILTGLMFGSLRVLWPWPNGLGITSESHSTETVSTTALVWPASTEWLAPTVAAIIGFALVLTINAASQRFN